MADTFLDLVNMVLDEIDEDQVTTIETGETREVRRVKKYLNFVYQELFHEREDWSWARFQGTITTSATVAAYSMDATVDPEKVEYVKLSNESPMELLSYQEFKRRYGREESTASGKPFIAYILNGQLNLFPTPSAGYDVEYVAGKIYVKMTTDAAEPYIPDHFRKVLFDGALWMAMRKDNDSDTTLQLQVYQNSVQKMRDSQDSNQTTVAITPEEETVMGQIDEIILWQ
jgi:hypothetical protein